MHEWHGPDGGISHETDVEKAAINRLDGWVQDWLDERIEKLCADIREADASAAGC